VLNGGRSGTVQAWVASTFYSHAATAVATAAATAADVTCVPQRSRGGLDGLTCEVVDWEVIRVLRRVMPNLLFSALLLGKHNKPPQ
jgi:hypothetical protein